MARIASTLGTFAALLVAGPAAAQTANEIYRESLERLGGEAAIEEIRSVQMAGSGMAFRINGVFTIEAEFPDRLRLFAETEPYQFVYAYDGRIGWERQSWGGLAPPAPPYLREVGGPRLDRLKLNVRFLPYQNVLGRTPELLGRIEWEEQDVYALRFSGSEQPDESYYVDAESMLPVAREYTSAFTEGTNPVITRYGDYRRVGDVTLPHRIDFPDPDLPRVHFLMEELEYRLNPDVADDRFTYPNAASMGEPYEVTMHTVPFGVYKEADWIQGGEAWDQNPRWGGTFGPDESWVFDLLVHEKHGRWLESAEATVDLFSGDELVKSTTFSHESLAQRRRNNVSRYSGMSSMHVFRHHFSEPVGVGIDRMRYRLTLEDETGAEVISEADIPVEYYDQKTELIFPIAGPFIVTSGHTYDDTNHKDEWTQWGAYDIIPLDPETHGIHTGIDRINENFYGFRRIEVMSPADGVVAYARNDIPDVTTSDHLSSGIPDPVQAIGGNLILIDHENGEVSLFAHLSEGSVRVQIGDRVTQGQVIGILGATTSTGYPHLHYQLQALPYFPRGDGFPSEFENLETLPNVPGTRGRPIRTPKRGRFLIAR